MNYISEDKLFEVMVDHYKDPKNDLFAPSVKKKFYRIKWNGKIIKLYNGKTLFNQIGHAKSALLRAVSGHLMWGWQGREDCDKMTAVIKRAPTKADVKLLLRKMVDAKVIEFEEVEADI